MVCENRLAQRLIQGIVSDVAAISWVSKPGPPVCTSLLRAERPLSSQRFPLGTAWEGQSGQRKCSIPGQLKLNYKDVGDF